MLALRAVRAGRPKRRPPGAAGPPTTVVVLDDARGSHWLTPNVGSEGESERRRGRAARRARSCNGVVRQADLAPAPRVCLARRVGWLAAQCAYDFVEPAFVVRAGNDIHRRGGLHEIVRVSFDFDRAAFTLCVHFALTCIHFVLDGFGGQRGEATRGDRKIAREPT